MDKHTPGPWEHYKIGDRWYVDDRMPIDKRTSVGEIAKMIKHEADARLIAAAPEMLAFIKSLVHLSGADAMAHKEILDKVEGK